MRLYTIVIDAHGVRLTGGGVAKGRVKAPPFSIARDRVVFSTYDVDGNLVYAGSFDHPLHRVLEYEDPAQPGTFRRIAHEEPEGVLLLRIPGDIPAARVAFDEVLTRGGQEHRAPLATFSLQ